MVRTLPYGSNPRLDFGRILAYAAVVAVHAFAALLLLIPLAAPAPENVLPDEQKPVIWVLDEIKDPPPPVPPETVPVRPQPPRAQPQQRVATDTPMPTADPVIVDNGNLAADPVSEGPATPDIAPPSGPVSVNQLAYIKATPPPYPRAEQTANIEGTVLLRILVDTDGTPLEVTIEHSSGSRNLDRAAQRHVLKTWRFQPAMQDGHAVQAYGLVPIVFSIQ